MKDSIIRQLSLYDYRYVIGYGLYAVLLVTLLLLNITDIPRGLSSAEIASATHSATSSIQSILLDNPINAPYTLLQKASLHFFGITPLAIKLPSLILAFATGMALVFMLRQWFRDNVAVLTSIIAATAGPFMTMGRTGTAMVLYAFWLSIILLAATKKLYGTEKTFKWKLLFFAAVALSLYTPMIIYPLIAIAIAGLLHPHVRFVLRHISLKKLVLVAAIALAVIAPLVWSIVQNPNHMNTLLGLPQAELTLATIPRNLFVFFVVFLDFSNIRIGAYVLPLFNATTMVLVLLGILRTFVDRHSARSYMILIWTALVLGLMLLNPSAIAILYIPIILFMAIGIETLIREWYRLFPRNPYARIAALIPLTILLLSISTADVARYFYGYAYTSSPTSFHPELANIRSILGEPALKNKPVILVTTDEELAFYDLLRRDYPNLGVTDTYIAAVPRLIVTETKYASLDSTKKRSLKAPYRIITTGYTSDSLLLRVYVAPN